MTTQGHASTPLEGAYARCRMWAHEHRGEEIALDIEIVCDELVQARVARDAYYKAVERVRNEAPNYIKSLVSDV